MFRQITEGNIIDPTY